MLAAVPVQTLRNGIVDGHFARRQLPTRVPAPSSSFLCLIVYMPTVVVHHSHKSHEMVL